MIVARFASRQALCGVGSRCGGLRHAATALRCSAWGGAEISDASPKVLYAAAEAARKADGTAPE